jgi:subtilisin family serine protease
MAIFFVVLLILSIIVSLGFSAPQASAQSSLPPSIVSGGSADSQSPILDPFTGGLINQYPAPQTHAHQDPYQIPYSPPTQTFPAELLSTGEQQLFQENSRVDVTVPETTISSVMDGNNVPIIEGGATTSNKVVLTVQGIDDIAATSFLCFLDNLQQDPSICSINPIVAENLQPGTHLFQISSVDSAGNVDATPAIFIWNVIVSDQSMANQQMPHQLQPQQQLPILPLQEQSVLPYQINISPYSTVVPNSSNSNATTTTNENQQTLQPFPSQSFQTTNPIISSPQYSTTDSGQTHGAQQSQYQQNLQPPPLQQQLPPIASSLTPFLPPSLDYSQMHQQQVSTANRSGTGNGGNGQIQNPSMSAEVNQAGNLTSTLDNKFANIPAASNVENINSKKQIPLQLSNTSISSLQTPFINDNNRSTTTTYRGTNSTFLTSDNQASLDSPSRLLGNITGTLDNVSQLALPPNSTSNNRTNVDPELLLQSSSNETIAPLLEGMGEKIPNQYIVVLKNRLTSEVVAEAKNRGASILNIYERVLNGFAIRVPNERVLEAIQRNPNIAYVEPDMKVQAFAQFLPRGVNRVDGDLSSTISGNGAGSVNADIAILDTGIQLSHPDLTVYRQRTFVAGTSSANDDNGHGTHVAGIAAAKDNTIGAVGMAPGARLWAVKVLDSSGSGSISNIIKGIDYVTQNTPIDIVNMSLGCKCASSSLNTAISNSIKAGITYVVAAGNSGQNAASFSPANHPSVIAVSAIVDTDGKCGTKGISTSYGGDDRLASFSNYGSVIDMAAPGVSIYSTYKGSTYATLSGTSMAAPHVAGAAALYETTHPGASPSSIANALKSAGSKPSTVCDGRGHGYFWGDRDTYREPLLYVNPF